MRDWRSYYIIQIDQIDGDQASYTSYRNYKIMEQFYFKEKQIVKSTN
jgi:hypothetical protein